MVIIVMLKSTEGFNVIQIEWFITVIILSSSLLAAIKLKYYIQLFIYCYHVIFSYSLLALM